MITRSCRVGLVLISLLIVGCATTPTATPPPPVSAPEALQSQAPVELHIDVDGLERALALNQYELGFYERSFNTCEVGYGYSSSHDCRQQFFAAVNFQLQCRDSNGTVSDVDYKVTPVVSDNVKWTFGNESGVLKTDSEGRGRVRAILKSSAKTQRIRLSVSGDFLILQAQDVRRIVAPKEWCEHL